MNFFLLFAVPLAALGAHRWLFPQRRAFEDPRSWILGFVWSIAALIVASFFGRWRDFTGELFFTFAGLTLTDVILVPGVVVAVWIFTRRRSDFWELGLWLSMVFAMAGIRDFVATRASYDMTELFLVPLDRILLILTLPLTVSMALKASQNKIDWYRIAAGGALLLSGSLFPVLSFAGWGWMVWILTVAGSGLGLFLQKKAASSRSGLSSRDTTEANWPTRP
jgi:hypothetical protein